MEGSAGCSTDVKTTTEKAVYGNLTVLEAIQSMDENDLKRSLMGVYIEPPEATVNSDEEELDEETIDADTSRHEDTKYGHLSKQHYETYAEVVFVNHKRVVEVEDLLGEEQDEKPTTTKQKENFVWENTEIPELHSSFPEPNYADYQNKTPVQVFEQIFNMEVINYIINETSKYAAQKNCQVASLTPNELKKFVGILLLSGYRGSPEEFWDPNPLLSCKLVVNAMQKNRFEEICNFIHFADSTKMNKSDKMWKLRPLMNLFQKRFIEMFKPEEHLSFGEYMADSCRRHNYFKWWDVPIGYKIWCLNGISGYLIDFDVFQRKNPNEMKYETKFGVPAASLVQMLDSLPESISKLPFKIYFNQFFTSVALLSHLRERGYSGTGALKDTEVPANCPLISSKEMKKKNKGACEYNSCVDKNIMIARMKDNSVITVGSTCHGLQVTDTIVDQGRKMSALYPSIFANYKKFKKGTNRMDQTLCTYGIRSEEKKWYWPLFTWLLDVAVHNSCVLMQKAGSNITRYEFRSAVVRAYLQNASNAAIE